MADLYSKRLESVSDYRLNQGIYLVGVVTTFIVSPWSNYDPISLPKMFTLSIGSFGILFLICSYWNQFKVKDIRRVLIISAAFFASMLSSIFLSGANIESQFWGSFGRNTGLLTYTCLLILLIASALVQQGSLYRKLISVFIFSSIPMTFYCIFQILGMDPIGWSEKFAFGTLGNVNFLSAFFGMTSTAALALAISNIYTSPSRLFLLALSIVDISIAAYTKSIQGPVIFVAGLFAILFCKIYYYPKNSIRVWIRLAYFSLTTTGLFGLFLALADRGPLASIIYQPSILFRADYMHAGFKMLVAKPYFGVGIDNYGSWYRELRGEISTMRTGPNRISNSAHNIFLDLGASGGLPLALAYLFLNFAVVIAIIKLFRSGGMRHPVAVAAFSSWVAYQAQATISINQIGVGVWGWILSGVLIGLSRISFPTNSVMKQSFFSNPLVLTKSTQLQAKAPIFITVGAILGFSLALPPLNADVKYRNASKSGNFEQIYQSTRVLGSTEFHKELLLDFAQKNNLNSEVWLAAKQLTETYPRNFYAWALMAVSPIGTVEEHSVARQIAKSLDPYNPDI